MSRRFVPCFVLAVAANWLRDEKWLMEVEPPKEYQIR
jgi:hypothetical protein